MRQKRTQKMQLRRRFRLAFIFLVWISSLGLASLRITEPVVAAGSSRGQPAGFQASSASELIQLVNQLRQSNGLSPYRINNALMAAAQAHSEYQASIGNVTHTGLGGTRPRDRAAAYGYGNGATVFVSENIAGGFNLSASKAVGWWQGDAPHLNTMLSPDYQDVGAGAAISGDTVYFTLDAGYVAGSAPLPQVDPPPADQNQATPTSGPSLTPTQTPLVIIPVEAATPAPDGSIVHVVQPGQVLWNIAAIYEIDLPDLLSLNDLNENSIIHPGDKLLLLRSAEITPTVIATETLLPSLEAEPAGLALSQPVATTPHPTKTGAPPVVTPLALAAVEKMVEESGRQTLAQPAAIAEPSPQKDSAGWLIVIAVFVVAGTALLLVGGALKRVA